MNTIYSFIVLLLAILLIPISDICCQEDNSLYLFGEFTKGQLGRIEAPPLNSSSGNDFIIIESCGYHSLGIKRDGSLWAWGRNDFGVLGYYSYNNLSIPTQIGTDTNWVSISTGDRHTLGIKRDGSLWSWGRNNYGQLGDGTSTDIYEPVQIGADTNWINVAAGYEYSIGIKRDGSLWSWGRNESGQLGYVSDTNHYEPTQIGTDTNWQSIAAGYNYSLGLKRDGSLWSWGWNQYGQLGDGTDTNRYNPTRIGKDTNWKSISASNAHSIAIKFDGSLWSWGLNISGQLGDGTDTNRYNPTRIGKDTNWVGVSAGGMNFSIGIKRDGSLWSWGLNYYGQLGDGTDTNRYEPKQIGTDSNWKSIAAGFSHSVGIKRDYSLWTWGWNNSNQLGDGTDNSRKTPTRISITKNWKVISAGYEHFLAIHLNGSLWSWGLNEQGQLGDGTNTNYDQPIAIGTDTDWIGISAGYAHSLAIKRDGSLWSWGWNEYGQLGDGTNASRHKPIQIGTDTDWIGISAGYTHSIAIKQDGSLWSWGLNEQGQLGDGSNLNHNQPIRVGTDTDWIMISAGNDHNLGLKRDGSLWSWGLNSDGQLGDGSNTNHNQPIRVGTDTDWIMISAGNGHNLGLKRDGSLWSWGLNSDGQIGDGTNTNHNQPIRINENANWEKISAGRDRSLALKSDGSLWAWGKSSLITPIRISGDYNWVDISSGGTHSIALNKNQILRPTIISFDIVQTYELGASTKTIICDDGGANVTTRGVQWSADPNFVQNVKERIDGSGKGIFTSSITNLNPNTVYYARPYAINFVGRAYGDIKSFTTKGALPSIKTNKVQNITAISAICGGEILQDGGSNIYSRGVCWSKNPGPTIKDNKTNDGPNLGSFTSSIKGLDPNTKYYVRAYATNSTGTAYGDVRIFQTDDTDITLPKLSTVSMWTITKRSARAEIGAIDNGGAGELLDYGVCWSANPEPTINDNTSNLKQPRISGIWIGGLSSNTTYYVKAYATNWKGTAYSDEISFTTLAEAQLPEVVTIDDFHDETYFSLTLTGIRVNDGGADIIAQGACWSLHPNPTIDDYKTSVSTDNIVFYNYITFNQIDTIFYIRVYATNEVGTAYSSQEKAYSTRKYVSVSDKRSDNESLSLKIFPNPTSDNIEISLTTSDCSNTTLKLYDMSGRLARDLSQELINSNSQTLSVNLSTLTSGEYTIILTCGNEKVSKSVIVAK